ncbi:MAG TPA: type III-A CRISPR-associated RAMP protein Csm4 [Bacteroidales bacterium]|nr:type III-A CRISPR-associated RAMP protein Csm4 [Bacteroidales bacterium]HOK75730.1 type III-A CRISPR-associated RAMP protein Csm4 [Bacteroidales bacterium]HOM40508.1 type III-A CRISPR-associated RAMP protein Csm4 [Bacteroidales bacterium]HPP93642.1 type III-A CRISPR-associated RAMP protein Csm4 [Bacteroidales bacterium]
MKIPLDIIRLHFTTPLHISNQRSDYSRSETFIQSDTLAAAIMQAWASLGKTEWITDNPGFAVSSLFPFMATNGNYIYFFPKPMKDKTSGTLPNRLLKKFKKIRYYQMELFEKRLTGRFEFVNEKQIHGEYYTEPDINEPLRIFSSSVVPRIMRPRNPSEDSVPFYMEKLYFHEKAGLFFILRTENEEAKSRFFQGLELLAETGLGSDRSVGNGRFNYSTDFKEINCPDESEYSISLSVFIPESDNSFINMLGENASYDLIRRGGWISEPFNSLRKRSVYMLLPGSVLKMNIKGIDVRGRVVDLKPLNINTHKAIYRSGRSIFLPLNP